MTPPSDVSVEVDRNSYSGLLGTDPRLGRRTETGRQVQQRRRTLGRGGEEGLCWTGCVQFVVGENTRSGFHGSVLISQGGLPLECRPTTNEINRE